MNQRGQSSEKGLIAWFASNHVAANLLMFLIIAFGIVSAFSIRKQTTPDFEVDYVSIQVTYPGAAPQEVEEGIVVKIEEAIQDIDGVIKIFGTAFEGFASIQAQVATKADLNEVLGEIKTRVDAVYSFPELAEKPVISKVEIPIHVVFVSLYGEMDDHARKKLSQDVGDELMAIPSVNQVEHMGDRPYEIGIEVTEHTLRRYGLTMSEVSSAIRQSAVDMPGGTINAEGGDIRLRTTGQIYTGKEYERLVLRTYPDGTRLVLGDVATVTDGFVEDIKYGRMDGQPSSTFRVLAGGDASELLTAAEVRNYIDNRNATLPEGVLLDVWVDRSYYLKDRLDLMLTNMFQGALLVFLTLTLFLRLKVALWVIVGIPVTFLGALWLMPHGPWPVTVNMLSLFGFILVLGIVVDDAIIIGESIYTKIRADGHNLDNVIRGTRRVATPATFGVLTTIAAFAPMLFVGGTFGPFFEAMSVVVILCLLFSLVESKLILPAHLAHAKISKIDEDEIFAPYRSVPWYRRISKFFQRIQRHVQHGLQAVIHRYYKPLLQKAVKYREITVVGFLGILVVTGGLIGSGIVRVNLLNEVPSDFIMVQLNMENGSSEHARDAAVLKIERALLEMNEEFVKEYPGEIPMIEHLGVFAGGPTNAQFFAEISKDENRRFEAKEINSIWRERVGEIPGVKDLTFKDGDKIGGGKPLSLMLRGTDLSALQRAGRELVERLSEFEGVHDMTNSLDSGAEEIRLRIKPEAEALGLTMTSLGRQVRQAFYGEEAQRIQRGRDEVRVMVRYPKEQRRSIADLENMRIRTPEGDEVPFYSVADIEFGQSYSRIRRQDRLRTVLVEANVDETVAETGEILNNVQRDILPEILARYPGLTYRLEGASREVAEFTRNLSVAAVAAMFLIYALIAVPLHSYTQPIIIMSVIPFGLIGAVVGHLVFGLSLSVMSLFGLVALAGVVVNDSLIMVDFINKAREEGIELNQAVLESGTMRFRAIILTSLTTFMGLMPIMFETSVQAQYLKPMAVSMSFGIVFATVITLFLVPCLYLMLVDTGYLWRKFKLLLFGSEVEYKAMTRQGYLQQTTETIAAESPTDA